MSKEKLVFESFLDIFNYFRTEKQAIDFFIKKRWNGKITCPFKECVANEFEVETNKIYTLASKKDFKCSCCKKIFSFKTGTVFENSKIPMKSWILAIYLNISDKKGISSPQLARFLKVRINTAWFMLQRIREIAFNFNGDNNFTGTTEMDETYVGGKAENKNNPIKKEKAKQ
ncbi:IS1595 family transposase [Candidatus Hepatincolaceae symbiont of Richtersius coronifer]